jgi:hypothetical protein
MTIEEALRKALDCVHFRGIRKDGLYEFASPDRTYFVWSEQFLTDPAFWQFLGKALGWENQQ